MDFFLFVIILVGFAALYLVLNVYLIWVLIILLLVGLIYVGIRAPRGKEDWPWGFVDNLYVIGMSAVIIYVFILVGPKPVPLIGDSIDYGPCEHWWKLTRDPIYRENLDIWYWACPLDAYMLLMSMIVIGLIFITLFALLIPWMQKEAAAAAAASRPESAEEERYRGKPRVGMGA
jgi:hypothetical protein